MNAMNLSLLTHYCTYFEDVGMYNIRAGQLVVKRSITVEMTVTRINK